jgi:hypothetical protein
MLAFAQSLPSPPAFPGGNSNESLAFTMGAENLTPLVDLAQILAGFGVVTVLLALLKHYVERRRWTFFKRQLDEWTDQIRDAGMRVPHSGDDNQWKAECERVLTEAGFSPLEINQILDLAVATAKGIAADKFLR